MRVKEEKERRLIVVRILILMVGDDGSSCYLNVLMMHTRMRAKCDHDDDVSEGYTNANNNDYSIYKGDDTDDDQIMNYITFVIKEDFLFAKVTLGALRPMQVNL